MNNYPERMFFEEKIQEIETERDMLKDQVLDLDQVIKKLKVEKSELEGAYLEAEAILEAIEEALEGKEPSDFMLSFGIVRQAFDMQRHNKGLEAENKDIRKMLLAGSPPYYEKWQKLREAAADAYDWAVLHGIEMYCGVWHRLKRELEKPDEMA